MQKMTVDRALKWERLIRLLEEANALQQELVEDSQQSYDYHNRLEDMAEDFESIAAAEERATDFS